MSEPLAKPGEPDPAGSDVSPETTSSATASESSVVDSRAVVLEVARFLDSKRAEEIAVLDVEELIQISSYFVIASGSSSRVLQTLAEGVAQILKKSGLPRLSIGGIKEGRWVCIDYGDVVVHLFDPETRVFYALDDLWGDAPKVTWE